MLCTAPDCDRESETRGLCRMHYNRFKRKGHTEREPPFDPVSTLWSGVDKSAGPDGCWPWTRSRSRQGYGHAYDGKKLTKAHRLAWQYTCGPIPDGLQVLHRCDNPPCCNPAHLWLGTNSANVADRVRKGRSKETQGEKHPQAKLTDEDVARIRRLGATPGMSQREIGEMFGIKQAQVSAILLRQSWRHVP